MKNKEILEIVVFPRLFNVVSFYSKGQYSVKVCVIQEDSKGNIVYGYPSLIEGR